MSHERERERERERESERGVGTINSEARAGAALSVLLHIFRAIVHFIRRMCVLDFFSVVLICCLHYVLHFEVAVDTAVNGTGQDSRV
jgi:hypothetical protein